MIQKVNDKNTSTISKQKLQKSCQRNNSLNYPQLLIAKSQENKIEIEVASSNQFFDSLSTQDSNYIKSSMEQKNLNVYILI